MPTSSNPFILLASAMLIVLALPLVLIGVVGLASFDEMWWLYGLLAAAGGLMLGGGAANVLRWKRALGQEESQQRAMMDAARLRLQHADAAAAIPGETASPVAAGPVDVAAEAAVSADTGPAPAETVLAHWTYPPAEWSAYTRGEARFRAREALGLGAGLMAMAVVIYRLIGADWGTALGLGGLFGVLFATVRGAMAAAAYRSNASARHGEVIIGPTAILLNGRYQVLDDGRIRFGGARLREEGQPPVLEITVMVPGKYRPTPEEYRIPIPAGREEEARALVDAFRRAYPDAFAR